MSNLAQAWFGIPPEKLKEYHDFLTKHLPSTLGYNTGFGADFWQVYIHPGVKIDTASFPNTFKGKKIYYSQLQIN